MRDHSEQLVDRGAAYPELFIEIEKTINQFDFSVCTIAFQLPFPLQTIDEIYTVMRRRQKVPVYLRFFPVHALIEPNLDIRITELHSKGFEPQDQQHRNFECTQCLAFIPLWGTRLEYYPKYLDLVRRHRLNEIVIPRHLNPYHDTMPGAVTGYMFEDNMATRTLIETKLAIRRFLADYAIVALDQVPRNNNFFSLFAVTAPDRVFSFGGQSSIGFGLLRRHQGRAIRVASTEAMAKALKWPIRDFSRFEVQIFALKRLADEGEPALALVGLMSLVEWYLNENLPDRGQKRLKLYDALNHSHYSFILIEVKDSIHRHRKFSNLFKHEEPFGASNAENCSGKESNEEYLSFCEAAAASFEIYRIINLENHKPKSA